jgi:hypothetical protein
MGMTDRSMTAQDIITAARQLPAEIEAAFSRTGLRFTMPTAAPARRRSSTAARDEAVRVWKGSEFSWRAGLGTWRTPAPAPKEGTGLMCG